MGVPKFFRWMSERYPAISQLIAENRIPEFDCLYLDMNGIIHNCTHSDSDSPTFRMTEDKMFIAIFNYIEHLFSKIKPQQLFFLAIDGVAPRAKMNQQRARRFRTALDAERAREKAINEGLEMPTEAAFDSNCITPGTEFMAKLTRQLKYFIARKVSEDKEWQGVEIVLSGHEVPGEGEHKIMEYMRHAKAQGNYNPNIRHCLYGLDADLIMLGLLSHDPHFCLLREEVTFGRQNQKKSKELEHQNFYLMHLSIVREYLELEFQELKDPSAMDFPFDMERVIDDFILMAFFVGNDFLPHLPNLHINEGALALMFKVYKSVLPKAGGYINEQGVIHLPRLGLLLDELSGIEYRFFEMAVQDDNWFKGKQMERTDVMGKGKKTKAETLTVSTAQKQIFKEIKKYVNNRPSDAGPAPLDLSTTLPARDRKFVEDLADALHLQWQTVENDAGERHVQLNFPAKLGGDGDDEEDEEAYLALQRVMKRYDNAKVVDVSAEDAKEQLSQKYDQKFKEWKDEHYKGKFGWGLENEQELRGLAENYVQGLQWVLYYYYRGVASWPWFYNYHYAPMISDVKNGFGASLNFKLGQPFRPYQQLMGVLPDRSKTIVPTVYHDLMTNPDSPIIDFYPRDFELDKNGKKMDWEAVVKIPFIEEDRLLKAMGTKDHLLSDTEKARNEFGVSLRFTYSPHVDFTYPSPLVGIFPDLHNCHCVENIFDLPTMDGLDVYIGLMDGVKLGASALAGFPSLQTIPHHATLDFHGVNIFQSDSRNESMIVSIHDSESRTNVEHAKKQLGQRVYVGYPFLSEAKVVRVSDEMFDYVLTSTPGAPPLAIPHNPTELEMWRRKAGRIEQVYSKRFGMVTGHIESLFHVETLKGLRKTDDGATIKEYGIVQGIETDYAAQMVVDQVVSEDQRFLEKAALPIAVEFPIGSRAFYLGTMAYGRPLEVIAHTGDQATGWVSMPKTKEPDFAAKIIKAAERLSPYTPSFAVARQLGLNPLVLSKLTASFSVNLDDTRLNLGLNLKFEGKKLKVLGFSRRGDSGWEFSPKAINLIQQYMIKFPEFIAYVQTNPKGDIYDASDMFPKDQARAKIKEIQSWLKSIESKNLEKVPLDAEQLDSEAVMQLEKAADTALPNSTAAIPRTVKGMPRSSLLKPSDAEHRLGNQTFGIGDRVVYVLGTGRVPIGTKGTVVGMTRTPRTVLLDVVFDVSFMSGTSLNDRCSPFRGSTVPVSSVLNLSTPQLQVMSSAEQARKPQQQSQPWAINGYGAPTGPGGYGQLNPAATPLPLRGSFRGAVGRQTNGGTNRRDGFTSVSQDGLPQQPLPIRNQVAAVDGASNRGGQNSGAFRAASKGPTGRGGGPSVNRQGYGPIDNGNPDPSVLTHSPNFRPRPYHSVAPPPALDMTGRGKGRGRGGVNGRGGNEYRGRGAERGRGPVAVQQQ